MRHEKQQQFGQAMVEFALILPTLLLVTLAVLDFGRAFYTYMALSGGVRDAARYGSRQYGGSYPSDFQNRVQIVAGNVIANPANLNVTYQECNLNATSCGSYSDTSGKLLKVQATYQYPLLFGLLRNSTITMSATAAMTID